MTQYWLNLSYPLTALSTQHSALSTFKSEGRMQEVLGNNSYEAMR
ncbi:hypothetical protein [Nostoc sp.]